MLHETTRKFWDEDAAYEFIEQQVWPDGPVCPHCGGTEHIGRLKGESTRTRTYKCYECRKPFTVKVGTLFEDSKVPLHKWLQALVLCRGGEHHINANQAGRVLGVTFKTASAMFARIRTRSRRNKDKEKEPPPPES